MKINVWNRQYEYENSFFPKSIKIGGEEILYKPISLDLCFGDKDGQWVKQQEIDFGRIDGKKTFAVTAQAENLTVNADITAEDDGLLKTDFRLMPFWQFCDDNVPRLTSAKINISVKKKFAEFVHFWPNCESGVCLSRSALNSHAVPDELKLGFKAYVWLGNDTAGLGICCESDKNFYVKDKESIYTVTDCGEYVNLKINLIDNIPDSWKRAEHWGNNIPILRYNFGIQATPVKAFNKEHLTNWRAFHLYDVDKNLYSEEGEKTFEAFAKSGANWLILHEDWTILQNYGMPKNIEFMKNLADKCHKLNKKLMVYFGYEVSSLLPGFNEKSDEMLNKNIYGNTVGGWQREPAQRDFTVCYNGSYSDIMLERVKYVMDELGVDGIYTDGTYIPWECANESHGCGYRDDEGNLHYTYPIYEVRNHVKKLYDIVHERGGVIDTHQSSCCMMATLGYADSYFDGENIQGMLSKDISKLKLDTFRAEFVGENMGIPCNFISYTKDGYTIRNIAGITLIHNIYPRANVVGDLPFMSKIWEIYDEYDISSAKWVSYYDENNVFTNNDEKIYVSYYERENDYLLIINSINEDAKEITLNESFKEIEDYLDGADCKSENGKTVIPVEYTSLKIVRVTK